MCKCRVWFWGLFVSLAVCAQVACQSHSKPKPAASEPRGIPCNALLKIQTASGAEYQGRLLRHDADSLVLSSGDQVAMRLPKSEVAELSMGKRNGLLGAALGVIAGAVVYWSWTLVVDSPRPGEPGVGSRPPLLYSVPLVTGSVGFLLGHKHKSWQPLEVNNLPYCHTERIATGISVRLSLAFGP
jgi:hypothetical protein